MSREEQLREAQRRYRARHLVVIRKRESCSTQRRHAPHKTKPAAIPDLGYGNHCQCTAAQGTRILGPYRDRTHWHVCLGCAGYVRQALVREAP